MNDLMNLLKFIFKRKVLWLIPILVLLLAISVLIVFSGSSAISPFIYTLF